MSTAYGRGAIWVGSKFLSAFTGAVGGTRPLAFATSIGFSLPGPEIGLGLGRSSGICAEPAPQPAIANDKRLAAANANGIFEIESFMLSKMDLPEGRGGLRA